MTKEIHPCVKCQAKCCQYFCFEIDAPDDYEQFEDIRWYLCHEGTRVHVDEDGDWYIQLANRCDKLTDDYRCSIYDDRPLICRSYSHENCEDTGEDYGYQHEFATPDQLDAYAIKTLGKATYEKEMIKHRAKLGNTTQAEMKRRLIEIGRIAPRKTRAKASEK